MTDSSSSSSRDINERMLLLLLLLLLFILTKMNVISEDNLRNDLRLDYKLV